MLCHCNRMQDACCHIAVSLTPDSRCMRCHGYLLKFTENIYQKHLYTQIVVPHHYKSIHIYLKGLSNKQFSCMRCHCHRMHDYRRLKILISSQIRSRIQKSFSRWIRDPKGTVWWKKNEGRKSRDTVPLSGIMKTKTTAQLAIVLN
jgi:hypothetical protein